MPEMRNEAPRSGSCWYSKQGLGPFVVLYTTGMPGYPDPVVVCLSPYKDARTTLIALESFTNGTLTAHPWRAPLTLVLDGIRQYRNRHTE